MLLLLNTVYKHVSMVVVCVLLVLFFGRRVLWSCLLVVCAVFADKCWCRCACLPPCLCYVFVVVVCVVRCAFLLVGLGGALPFYYSSVGGFGCCFSA